MYVKMRSRLSATISASQEKRKFVLEDVFWVPISNCSSRHSTSRFVTPFQMGAYFVPMLPAMTQDGSAAPGRPSLGHQGSQQKARFIGKN
jgi:hypothetical protein